MGDIAEDESSFYSNAEDYWKEVPPTVDGMSGGYGSISSIDINGSKAFSKKFSGEGEGKTGTGCASDCGAGIGRITKRSSLPSFRTVDSVDVTKEFSDKARTYSGDDGKRVGNYFCCGSQDFVPKAGRYDVIWIQWVIGHSTDDHSVEFSRRCQRASRPGGSVVVKDNVSYEGVVPDQVDSSVCRDSDIVSRSVGRAGSRVVHQERQQNFPKELYQVHTSALR